MQYIHPQFLIRQHSLYLIKEGVGLGVPSKNYGYLAAKKPLVLIIDKQSDIDLVQFLTRVSVDEVINGMCIAIINLDTRIILFNI
jgi:hypothetical protein